jgi:twitching motility protein PilT
MDNRRPHDEGHRRPGSEGYETIPLEPDTAQRRPTHEQMPAVSVAKSDSQPEQFAAMARRLHALQEEVLKLRKEVRSRPEARDTDQKPPTAPAEAPPPTKHATNPNGPPAGAPADAPRPILPPDWGMTLAAPARDEHEDAARRNQIDFFLRLMIDRGASDLHVHVGNSPIYRQGGQIAPMRFRPLRQRDWDRLIRPICPPGIWDAFHATGDIDFAYEVPEVARFRVNLLRQHHGAGAVFRIIPTKILTLDQLGMPQQLARFAELNSGLVLITGPTGSGKSTTLAALIDMINRQKASHIVTIEDPIEFVHPPRNSLIHQREIGAHAATFYEALQAAMREDPDLILVGELRDRETMNLALQAAEKGMLVYGTLHTNSAAKTVDRIINAFPTDEQDQIRTVLASTLRGVVAQQLLRRTTGGRVAALEILFSNRASANLIRENKTHHLNSFIQTGSRDGMVLMDQSLMTLVQQGTITRDAALEKAIDKNLFLKA